MTLTAIHAAGHAGYGRGKVRLRPKEESPGYQTTNSDTDGEEDNNRLDIFCLGYSTCFLPAVFAVFHSS